MAVRLLAWFALMVCCQSLQCDVAVAGGSLAGLVSALTAADVSSDVSVCLIEPTDWPGGQLTSSAVSALDFGHTNNVPSNMPRSLRDFVALAATEEKQGQCWVSKWCFTPDWALNAFVVPQLRARSNIHLLLRSVVVATTTAAAPTAANANDTDISISSLQIVTRTPLSPQQEWAVPLSADLSDWYSPAPSPRFSKEVSEITASIFIEATELGDVLATAAMPLQSAESGSSGGSGAGSGPRLPPPRLGVETPTETSATTNAACTQATTLPFFEMLSHEPPSASTPPPPPAGDSGGIPYGIGKFSWEQVWSYRRSIEAGSGAAAAGDNTQQNWGQGNDYTASALLLPLAPTPAAAGATHAAGTGDTGGAGEEAWRRQWASGAWQGGVDLAAVRAAEQRAFGYHHWYKQLVEGTGQGQKREPPTPGAGAGTGAAANMTSPKLYVYVNRTSVGTAHGLSKLPYLRDTRRPCCGGLDGYILTYAQISSDNSSGSSSSSSGVGGVPSSSGLRFYSDDRVALGDYPTDMHFLQRGCNGYPNYVNKVTTTPFTIPFRALTVRRAANLLVAGKTMAVSFHANAATRVHPSEWSTGVAAGAAAALMVRKQWHSTRQAYESVAALQSLLQTPAIGQPLEWAGTPTPAPAPPSPTPPAPVPPTPVSSCCTCVLGGRGTACASACASKGSKCDNCVKYGGGVACGKQECGCQ